MLGLAYPSQRSKCTPQSELSLKLLFSIPAVRPEASDMSAPLGGG
jgi:hypothetical protein